MSNYVPQKFLQSNNLVQSYGHLKLPHRTGFPSKSLLLQNSAYRISKHIYFQRTITLKHFCTIWMPLASSTALRDVP